MGIRCYALKTLTNPEWYETHRKVPFKSIENAPILGVSVSAPHDEPLFKVMLFVIHFFNNSKEQRHDHSFLSVPRK